MYNQAPQAGLASLLASRGRNGDSMLVHMAPSEVKGLQALALAHGGSLSINPETGLYEANFLKKLLPTIIGAVLTPLTGGLINPFTAGLLVGGVETIRTGDLGRGLMAGLGAYGGAGLSTALAGTGAAAGAVTSEAVTKAGAEAAAAAAKEGATQAAQEAAKQAAMREAAQKAVQDKLATGAGKGLFGKLPQGVASFKNIGTGAGEIFKTGGAGLGGIGGMGAAGSAFNALSMPMKAGLISSGANALTPDMEVPEGATDIDQSYYQSYGYDPETGTFRGGQWLKGYPGFPGSGMAGGGIVPRPNPDYPMGVMQQGARSFLETNAPREVVGGYDALINPMTGQERPQVNFAAGGAAFGRKYEEMPIDPALAQPNSAKAGWMQYMQQNPAEQKRFIDAGYPAEFFQQDPQTFTGNRPFVAGKDEEVRAAEQARLAKQGIASPSTMSQYQSAPQNADSFSSYLQNLNQFVTSPIAPPKPTKPPPPPPAPPAGGTSPYGIGARQPMGGRGLFGSVDGRIGPFNFSNLYDRIEDGGYSGYGGESSYDGDMRWDANQGRFVSSSPDSYGIGQQQTGQSPYDFSGVDFSNLQNINMSGIGGTPYSPSGQDFITPNEPIVYDTTPMQTVYDQLGQPGYANTPYSNISEERQQLREQYGYGDLYGSPSSITGNELLSDVAPPTQPFDYTPAPSYTPPEPQQVVQEPIYQAPESVYAPAKFYEGFYKPPQMAYEPPPAPSYVPPEPSYTPPDSYYQEPVYAYGVPDSNPNYQMPSFYTEPMESPSDYGMYGGMNFNDTFAGGGSVEYAASGRLLRGPGDGMSDDIKANISGKQEARLADGEFVIPADVVSHLGNGSSEAGSRKLYKLMADVRRARTGKSKQAPAINVNKHVKKLKA